MIVEGYSSEIHSRLLEPLPIDGELIATPAALHAALDRAPRLEWIKDRLHSGVVTFDDVLRSARDLLNEFETGVRFPHDLSLAAAAVLATRNPSAAAAKFLRDLAELNSMEICLSPAVAKICLSARERQLASNTTQSLELVSLIPTPVAPVELAVARITSSTDHWPSAA